MLFFSEYVGLVGSKKLQTVSQDCVGKMNFGQMGVFEYTLLQKTQTTYSFAHPSIKTNSQQTEIKRVWNFLAKQFEKSNLQEILQRRVYIEIHEVF